MVAEIDVAVARLFEHSAMGDLLGEDIGLVQPNNLYRCLDKLTAHKQAMFTFLGERWKELFAADFEVLLYDLTSTYFECDPPGDGKRKFGYSRDKRSDCVQVVIALIVTPDGFPLAYEVMDGNTSDKTTLKEFLAKIEKQYGKAKRTWVMDRGIPTEEVLAEMRNSKTPIHYLVGSPRGRLTQLEKAFVTKPWEDVRESVRVKLIEHGEETYVLARSQGRRDKEQSMRRRRLKKLIKRLRELQQQNLTRDDYCSNSARPIKRRARPMRCWSSTRRRRISRSHQQHSTSRWTGRNCGRPGDAKAAICCAPISRAMILAICGGSISNWSRSSRRSRS